MHTELAATIERRKAEARQRTNPNTAKRHLALASTRVGSTKLRADGTSRRRTNPVTTKYLPGKTVAARIAGIQAHYDRAARIAL